MAGTLRDIVRQGAAPPEAFGFARGGGHSSQNGGSGRSDKGSTPAEDGPVEKMPRNKQA